MSATRRGETFFLSLYKCILHDRVQSKHMPRYDGCGPNFNVTLGCICRLAVSWPCGSSGERQSTQSSQRKAQVTN